MPRFSIIVTCHNQASSIRDAVCSALAQDYPEKEVIVVDDCSTDESRKVLEEYGQAIKIETLETNQGAGAARNWGAAQARGEFLVFLDGDDLLLPWALEVYGRIIDSKHPKLILGCMLHFRDVFSLVDLSNVEKEIAVVEYECYMKKDRKWQPSASALVVERKTFNDFEGWATIFFPAEDLDLAFRLGYSGRTITIVSPQTTAYRKHASNTSLQLPRMIDSALGMIQREKAGLYPGGRACRFERYAMLGGIAFYQATVAFDEKLYGKGLKLISAGWAMILAATCRKFGFVVRGRRPVENLGAVSKNQTRGR